MKRSRIAPLAGWLVLAAFVLSGLGCTPTMTKSTTGGASNSKTAPSTKGDNPPKRDPG